MKAYWAWIVAGPVMACLCADPAYGPVCDRFGVAPVAFLGTVIDRNDDGKGRALTLVHVDEAYKGLLANEWEVFVDPGSFAACGTAYNKGKQYVFFAAEARPRKGELQDPKEFPVRWASKKKLRVLSANGCSGSREAAHSVQDLSWLRKWRTTPSRVYGSVRQNFTGHPWPGPSEGSVPLPFAPVTLMGVNGTYSAKTDVDGRYLIEFVKPGKYLLSASQFPWRLEKSEEIEITESFPCAEQILNMQTSGVVRGSVIGPTGVPAPGVRVELVRRLSGGKLAREETLGAKTDEKGRFVLDGVPSAAFAIGVNLVSPPTHTEPYRNVRFERVIEVAPNGEVNGIVIKLPMPMKERLVTVRVFWADGTPVEKFAHVWAEFGERRAASARTATGNVGKLQLLQGLAYQLHADRLLGGAGFATADPFPLPAGTGPAVVDIRLRTPRP